VCVVSVPLETLVLSHRVAYVYLTVYIGEACLRSLGVSIVFPILLFCMYVMQGGTAHLLSHLYVCCPGPNLYLISPNWGIRARRALLAHTA
jgi:hypothetical protein